MSVFWICGKCGFKNAPHAHRQGEKNNACEQCGTSHEDEDYEHTDYRAGA